MNNTGHWFKSSLFRIEPGEDLETNPRRYGKQAAQWLSNQLAGVGYDIHEIVPEDWGRCTVINNRLFSLRVGVSSVDSEQSENASADTKDITWHCFPVVEVPFWKRIFRKVETQEIVTKLQTDLGDILSSHGEIHVVEKP